MSRLSRVISVIGRQSGRGSLIGRICPAAAEVLSVAGAGLAVMMDRRADLLCVYGVGAQHGENLQLTLGEGPGADVRASSRLVDVGDLRNATDRWPGFVEGMAGQDVAAVASFPLMVGVLNFGALTVYRSRPGDMSDDQVADGFVLAQLASYAVMTAQSQTDEGKIMDEMEHGFAKLAPVHQATGMLMAYLQVGPSEAFAILRSRSYAESRSVVDLGMDVVAGMVALDPVQ